LRAMLFSIKINHGKQNAIFAPNDIKLRMTLY